MDWPKPLLNVSPHLLSVDKRKWEIRERWTSLLYMDLWGSCIHPYSIMFHSYYNHIVSFFNIGYKKYQKDLSLIYKYVFIFHVGNHFLNSHTSIIIWSNIFFLAIWSSQLLPFTYFSLLLVYHIHIQIIYLSCGVRISIYLHM